MYFVNVNFCILIRISLKFLPNWQYASIGSGNGLSPVIERQTITWINDDPAHSPIYAALGGDELTEPGVINIISLAKI